MDDDLPEAIPAATLILMRPSAAGGPPEILMLERSETMAFAAGALVFPGGRIDPEDHALAARFPVHVVTRTRPGVWNLRSRRCFARIERAFWAGGRKDDFRLVHFAVQGNHIHLVVEATDQQWLARGMQGLNIRIAKEVANEGIRVNAVRPGLIYTDIHAGTGDPGRVDRLKSLVPMQRGGAADEVAEAVLWLCSEQASYCTGMMLDVTGGRGI